MTSRIPGFDGLVAALMSTDNGVRKQAEKEYEDLKQTSPDSISLHLLELLNSTEANLNVRSLAAILLRGALTKNNGELFCRLNSATRQTLQTELLASLLNEGHVQIRRKTCDAVGELGRKLVDSKKNEWPQLVQYVLANVTSDNPNHRESAFSIFEKISTHFAANASNNYQRLNQIFSASFCVSPGDNNVGVHVSAIKAWAALLQSIGNANDRTLFTSLLSEVLRCLQASLEISATPEAIEILKVLIEICEDHAKIFQPLLGSFINLMSKVIENGNIDASVRQLSLELVVTVAETKPSMCRKLSDNSFVTTIVPAIFVMMLGLEEFASEQELHAWANSDDDDDDGDSDSLLNFCHGASGLDRLACSIGGDTVLPVTFQLVSQYASSNRWQDRHAALVAISQISEVIVPTFQGKMPEIVTTVLQFMNGDPHPKVRSAAISAIGNLCMDPTGLIQEDYHAIVIPALIRRLEEDLPRLQSRAATAIDFFVDSCSPMILEKYLKALLEILFKRLSSGPLIVQNQVIPAISSIAYASESHFAAYYPHCVPILKQLIVSDMSSMTKKQASSLRAKTIECVASIGKAAGKKTFIEDSKWLMKALNELQNQPMDDDDPQRTCIFSAWNSICECLGDDFEPYLGYIMPTLLQTAQINIDYEAYANQAVESGGFGGQGDIGIDHVRTSDIDEKISACSMLGHFCRQMGSAYFPFVKDTAQVLGPLCLTENELFEDIRMIAAAAMPDLICSVAQKFSANDTQRGMVKEIMDFALNQLLTGLQSETDLDVLKTMCQAIPSCVAAGLQVPSDSQIKPTSLASKQRTSLSGNMSIPELERICVALLNALRASMQRRAICAAEHQIEDSQDDDEDARILMMMEFAQEEELQMVISQALAELFPLYKDVFMDIIDRTLLNPILDMSHPKRIPGDRKFAIFVIDDIIEYLAPECAKHLPKFINILIANTCDPDHSVRQGALYGVGVTAEKFGSESLQDFWQRMVATLLNIIDAPGAYEGDAQSATDNGVSALGKIIRYVTDPTIDKKPLIKKWISKLPLRMDVEESLINMRFLVEEIQKNNSLVIGEQGENLAQIAIACATAIGTESAPQQLAKDMITILDKIKQSVPPKTMESVWSALPHLEKTKLERIIEHNS